MVRRDPIPSQGELDAIYRADDYFRLSSPTRIGYGDYFADEVVYRPYFRTKFAELRGVLPVGGHLLEIGAAVGFALDEARRAGWDAEGLELSPKAVAYGRERFGLRVTEGGVEQLRGEDHWDVIAAFQVVEHLPDIRGALSAMKNALRPGGHLVLTTPDHGSLVRRLSRRFWPAYRPEHLLYLDRQSIRTLLTDTGFSVERIRTDSPLRVPIGRIVERAGHYYFGRSVDPSRFPPVTIPVWLGDMEVIARRAAP